MDLSSDHDPTNADLAALLTAAYRDQDALRRDLALYKKRADKADRLAKVLLTLGATSSSSPAPPSPPVANGNGNGTTDVPSSSSLTLSPQLAPQHAQQIHQIVDDYEEKLSLAEAALEDAEARNKESWRQMDDVLASLELHAQNARSFARPYLNLHHTLFTESPTAVGFSSSSSMAPPPAGGPRQHSSHSRSHSHSQSSHVHAHSSRLTASRGTPVAFTLPPHPIPNPNVTLSHAPLAPSGSAMGGSGGGSARRPRTPSMDNLYAATQPPTKRSRASASLDDQRAGTRAAYSESYIASPQHQQSELHIRSQHALQRHPTGASGPGGAPSPLPEAQARIIDRKYRSSASTGLVNIHPNSNTPSHPHARGAIDQQLSLRDRGERGERAHTPTHSRSGSHSSASSMDVDEMIIKATTGDEASAAAMGNGAGTPNANGSGRGYLDSPHHQSQQQHFSLAQQQQQQQHQVYVKQQQQLAAQAQSHHRRRSDRERDSPISNPYPPGGQQGGQGYPANQSAPMRVLGGGSGSGSGSAVVGGGQGGQGGGQGVYTTVFAPVVTGAPTKKSKFPNSSGSIGAVGAGGVGCSGPSLDTLANATSTTQTSQPTVPFPATNQNGQRICRQCGIVGRYKDGKCVEKWGPGPMGPGTVCDRCRKKMKRVERRGTLESQQQQQLASLQSQQQQQLQPRSNSHAQLPLSQNSDRSIQRSDTILTHQQSFVGESSPNLRSSTGTNQSTATATFTSSSKGTSARHQPTPPTIASLREQHDDEDDENGGRDPEQLPTSNIGRGVSAVIAAANVNSNGSRSNSRNGRVRAASGKPTPPVIDSSYIRGSSAKQRTSISPRGTVDDEMDADADADAEAEAEAEILGAVDAAADGDGDDLDGDGEGDGEGDLENDADAEAELLEAVDAAEANSNSSSHGGERSSWLKSEPN